MALLKSNNDSRALSLHVNVDGSTDLGAIVRQFGGKFFPTITKDGERAATSILDDADITITEIKPNRWYKDNGFKASITVVGDNVEGSLEKAVTIFPEWEHANHTFWGHIHYGLQLHSMLLQYENSLDFRRKYSELKQQHFTNNHAMPNKTYTDGLIVEPLAGALKPVKVHGFKRGSGLISQAKLIETVPEEGMVELWLLYLSGKGVNPGVYGTIVSESYGKHCDECPNYGCSKTELFAGNIHNMGDVVFGFTADIPDEMKVALNGQPYAPCLNIALFSPVKGLDSDKIQQRLAHYKNELPVSPIQFERTNELVRMVVGQ